MRGNPPIHYCPFCGEQQLKVVKGVRRCTACRTVFCVGYYRRLRAAPMKQKPIQLGIPKHEVVPY